MWRSTLIQIIITPGKILSVCVSLPDATLLKFYIHSFQSFQITFQINLAFAPDPDHWRKTDWARTGHSGGSFLSGWNNKIISNPLDMHICRLNLTKLWKYIVNQENTTSKKVHHQYVNDGQDRVTVHTDITLVQGPLRNLDLEIKDGISESSVFTR